MHVENYVIAEILRMKHDGLEKNAANNKVRIAS